MLIIFAWQIIERLARLVFSPLLHHIFPLVTLTNLCLQRGQVRTFKGPGGLAQTLGSDYGTETSLDTLL